jgi:hypothetical protein
VKRLTLKRETLADLTAAELGSVAGASGVSCNTVVCYSNPCSDFMECITGLHCLSVGGGC